MNLGSEFLIDDYSVGVHLGVTEEENSVKQQVRVAVKIDFKGSVKAETTDQLKDTLDYVEVINVINQECESKVYKLIESLAYTLAQAVISSLSASFKNTVGSIEVSVYKIHVPVKNLKGVKWTYRQTL